MSTVTTFGAFNAARLGIYVSSRAIDVVANNVTNINTEGYTRQKVDQASLYMGGSDRYYSKMDQRIGQGAIITGISQLRDPYLDIRYRNESNNVGACDQKMYYVEQLSGILDEVAMGSDGEGVVEAQLNKMISEMELLASADGAGKDINDSLVRGEAESLCQLMNKKANDLQDLWDTEDMNFKKEMIPHVNEILTKIQDLTSSIRKSQIHSGNPLELLDRRNLLIDELSEYMRINVTYSLEDLGDGLDVEKMTITTANHPKRTLVDGVYVTQLSIRQEKVREQAVDDAGNPLFDNNWDPIYKVNADGSPVYVQAKDADGNPIFEQAKDSTGRLVFEDAGGNLYYKDDEGKYYDDSDIEETDPAVITALTQKMQQVDAMQDSPLYYLDLGPLKNLRGEVLEQKLTTTPEGTAYAGWADAQTQLETLRKKNGGYPKTKADADGFIRTEDYRIYKTKDNTYQVCKIEYNSGAAKLNDTELSGRIQSSREMLTEKGEYATKADEAIDPQAAVKRGIPYYQRALDTLASTFARTLNQANVAPATSVYVNDGTNFMDAGNNPIKYVYDGPGSPATVEWITDTDKVPYAGPYAQVGLDPAGKPIYHLVDLNDVTTLSSAPVLKTNYKTGTVGDMKVLVDENNNAITSKSVPVEFIVAQGDKFYTATRNPTDGTFTVSKTEVTETDFKAANFTDTWSAVPAGIEPYKDYTGGILFSNSSNNNDPNYIRANNISITDNWAHGRTRMLNSTEPYAGSTANDNLRHMLVLLQKPHPFSCGSDRLNADPYFNGSFQQMLTENISGTLASDQRTTSAMLQNYATLQDELYVDRESVSGVDLNDEAADMMQLQKSYAAACRLMTTVDSMLDKLINGTAV